MNAPAEARDLTPSAQTSRSPPITKKASSASGWRCKGVVSAENVSSITEYAPATSLPSVFTRYVDKSRDLCTAGSENERWRHASPLVQANTHGAPPDCPTALWLSRGQPHARAFDLGGAPHCDGEPVRCAQPGTAPEASDAKNAEPTLAVADATVVNESINIRFTPFDSPESTLQKNAGRNATKTAKDSSARTRVAGLNASDG